MPIVATASVPTRCRQAIACTIRPHLTGGPLGTIHRLYEQVWDGNDTNALYPCVVVSPALGQAPTREPGGNDYDDVGFPTRVAVFDRRDKFSQKDFDENEGWLYTLDRLFNGLPLVGVAESVRCEVEPFVIAEWEQQAYQRFVGGMVVRSWCRVPVGLS